LSVLGSDPSRKATRLLLKNSADPSVGLGAVHPALQVGVVLRPGVEAIHRDGHLGCYECHRGDPFPFGTAVVWTAVGMSGRAAVEQRRCNAAGPIHRTRSGPCSVRAREEGTEIVQQATRARFSALDGVQPVEVDALFGVGQPCLLGAGLQHDGGQRG
jgi:hypothetical protein